MKQILFITLLFAINISAQNVNVQIEQAMKHYNNLITGMNTDSISQMYSPDGELGNAAKGRDSIKSFLNKFKQYKVKLQESTTGSIKIDGDTAIQNGNYHQITFVPGHGDVEVKGRFTATWVRSGMSRWLLKRMDAIPGKKK